MVLVEGEREGRLSQVEVEKEHLCRLERHAGCDVHDRVGLTCVRIQGGEHYHVCLARFLVDHHVEVRPEHSVCLVHHVALRMLDDDLRIGVVHLLLFSDQAEPVLPGLQRDLRKERHLRVREVHLAVDRRVHDADQEDDAERYATAEDHGHKKKHHLVGGHRIWGAVRVLDEAGVAHVHKGSDLVLLALLQEEEVEGLLHRLLALDAEQLKLLARAGGYPVKDLPLLALDLAGLHLKGGHVVVYRAEDRGAHSRQGRVLVRDQRVVRAAVLRQAVALEDEVVVFGYLRLHAGGGEAEVGGDQRSRVRGIVQILLDEVSHRELVVHLERLR